LFVGIEVEEGASQEGVDGDDVPGVFGDDVGGDEVYVVFGVEVASTAFDLILAAGAGDVGAFDLHPPDEAALGGADQDVNGVAFSPRFGDGKIEADGAGDKGGFGSFSATFAVGLAEGVA